MKTTDEYREEAIDFFIGQIVTSGTIVGHRSYDIATKFLRYEGDEAIVLDKLSMKEMRFPRSEIFDVNAVDNRAVANKTSDLNKHAALTN